MKNRSTAYKYRHISFQKILINRKKSAHKNIKSVYTLKYNIKVIVAL